MRSPSAAAAQTKVFTHTSCQTQQYLYVYTTRRMLACFFDNIIWILLSPILWRLCRILCNCEKNFQNEHVYQNVYIYIYITKQISHLCYLYHVLRSKSWCFHHCRAVKSFRMLHVCGKESHNHWAKKAADLRRVVVLFGLLQRYMRWCDVIKLQYQDGSDCSSEADWHLSRCKWHHCRE